MPRVVYSYARPARHFTLARRYTLFALLLFITGEILRIVFQNTATNHHSAPSLSLSLSLYFPYTTHSPSGTYSIDRSTKAWHDSLTVDPREFRRVSNEYPRSLCKLLLVNNTRIYVFL